MKRHGQFFVYIVECRDGTYYTGYTSNLEKRLKAHKKGNGAKYLRGKLPVRLVYAKPLAYYKNAVKEERRIKRLSRKGKEALVEKK